METSLVDIKKNDRIQNKARLTEIEHILNELEYSIERGNAILKNDQAISTFKQVIHFFNNEYKVCSDKEIEYNSKIDEPKNFKSFG